MSAEKKAKKAARVKEAEELARRRSAQARLRGLQSAMSFTPEQRRERASKAGLAASAKRRAAREAAGIPGPVTRSASRSQPTLTELQDYFNELDELYPDRVWTAEERRSEAILLLRKDLLRRELGK